MLHYHHFHRHKRSSFGLSDFSEFQMAAYLHVIGSSLVSIFIPVLLLTHGFTLRHVLWYLLLSHAINVPLNFFARSLVRNLGSKWTIVLAVLVEISFFLLLNFINPSQLWFLALLALLAAISDTTYWVPNIYLFVSTGKKRVVRKNTGIYYALSSIAALFGPTIGAVILIFGSDSALLLTSVCILFLSIIPLFFIKNLKDRPIESNLPTRHFFQELQEKQNFASYALWTIHRVTEYTLFPLFIFVTFGSIKSVALVAVIASLVYAAGSYRTVALNKYSHSLLIVIGGLAVGFIWISRLYVHDPTVFFFSIAAMSVFSLFVDVPLDSQIYTRAKQQDPLLSSTWQNAVSMGSKAIVFAVLLLLIEIFHTSFFMAIFAIALLVTFNIYLFCKHRR